MQLTNMTLSQLHCHQARWCPGTTMGKPSILYFSWLTRPSSVASLDPSSAASSSAGKSFPWVWYCWPLGLDLINTELKLIKSSFQLQACCHQARYSFQGAPRDSLFVPLVWEPTKLPRHATPPNILLTASQTLTSRRSPSSPVCSLVRPLFHLQTLFFMRRTKLTFLDRHEERSHCRHGLGGP